jgi:hypothetical protein
MEVEYAVGLEMGEVLAKIGDMPFDCSFIKSGLEQTRVIIRRPPVKNITLTGYMQEKFGFDKVEQVR